MPVGGVVVFGRILVLNSRFRYSDYSLFLVLGHILTNTMPKKIIFTSFLTKVNSIKGFNPNKYHVLFG